MPRVYLDNAATSWPKPEVVYETVDRYQRESGVPAGRGSYQQAEEIGRRLQQTRVALANLIGAEAAANIIFTFNCTDALNQALYGLLRRGDHVVTSAAEHNSILRPLAELAAHRGVTSTTVGVDQAGVVRVDEVRQAINTATKLIAITHASNVTGALQPIDALGRLAKEHGCRFLVDAAQTVGHVPISVASSHIDLLAAPGHKGLLGPLGTGLLYVAPEIVPELRSTRQGGTGTQSESPTQPLEPPAKYESGNLNVPGLLGLEAGVQFVDNRSLVGDRKLRELSEQLILGLAELDDVVLYSAPNDCGIVSFNIRGFDPREVAGMLDSSGGIQVRAGLHCAPRMHESMGTFDSGGTVRASCGHFNSPQQIERAVELIAALVSSTMS